MNSDGNKRKEKDPPFSKYKCTLCNDVIQSSYSGEFVTCSCGKCSVDQTQYYTRLIGNIHDMELVKDE